MNWDFWKGVLVGSGGLFLLMIVMGYLGWIPYLLLGAAGLYGVHRLSKKSPDSLSDPSSRARQIADEVDRRIDQLRR